MLSAPLPLLQNGLLATKKSDNLLPHRSSNDYRSSVTWEDNALENTLAVLLRPRSTMRMARRSAIRELRFRSTLLIPFTPLRVGMGPRYVSTWQSAVVPKPARKKYRGGIKSGSIIGTVVTFTFSPLVAVRRWLGLERHICPDCWKSFDCTLPKECDGRILLRHSEYSGPCSRHPNSMRVLASKDKF